jgi:hypothetical protein
LVPGSTILDTRPDTSKAISSRFHDSAVPVKRLILLGLLVFSVIKLTGRGGTAGRSASAVQPAAIAANKRQTRFRAGSFIPPILFETHGVILAENILLTFFPCAGTII